MFLWLLFVWIACFFFILFSESIVVEFELQQSEHKTVTRNREKKGEKEQTFFILFRCFQFHFGLSLTHLRTFFSLSLSLSMCAQFACSKKLKDYENTIPWCKPPILLNSPFRMYFACWFDLVGMRVKLKMTCQMCKLELNLAAFI